MFQFSDFEKEVLRRVAVQAQDPEIQQVDLEGVVDEVWLDIEAIRKRIVENYRSLEKDDLLDDFLSTQRVSSPIQSK